MFKPALGIMFSLLAATFAAPSAIAAESTETPAVSNAPAEKKSGLAKHKHKKSARKHHAAHRADDSVASDKHQKLARKVIRVHGHRKVVYQRVSTAPMMF